MNVKTIIQNMSSDTRAKAEAFASAKGMSLEQAVAAQLAVELSESDLSAVAGGAAAAAEEVAAEETIA
ncbi:hypothetical protein [Cystobacter ferrugineus]|uniref:Uncharacterized protein n=1 Tax=Cystobacter ferrugineus TaxID=83449 RepID=A0A1L9B723_9BACT|nr:hypothetical protein [Cystobacter ferrugineus]OJH38045.1 hypothetical protein BON30_23030 [Cystobacter ferrugineus]